MLHDRHKLVANQCLSMGPAELQPDLCEQNKGIQQLLTKEQGVILPEQCQTLGVDVITEFTAGIFPPSLS